MLQTVTDTMAYISTGAFADGCMVSFDTARRELVFTMATGGTMTTHDLPARPFAASAFAVPEANDRAKIGLQENANAQ